MLENLKDWVDEEKQATVKKGPLYKSKFDPNQAPSHSSFVKPKYDKTPQPKKRIIRKPALPDRKEVPKHGMVSKKNYVVANAVQVILSSKQLKKKAAAKSQGPTQYVKKADYGKVPSYLHDVKMSIEMEKELLREYYEEVGDESMPNSDAQISEEEREELIKQLKRKWDQLNYEYQKKCGGAESDSKKKNKEYYEKQLKLVEDDIKLLSRGPIKIYGDE